MSDTGAPGLSTADLQHLAHLARLTLAPEQAPAYAAQLQQILTLFEGLRAVDTSDIGQVVATFEDLLLTPRPDAPVPSLYRDVALQSSGRRIDAYLTVPRVLGGASEEG